MRMLILPALLLAAASVASTAAAQAPAVTVSLSAPDRPAADTALDAGRKPLEVIAFSGVRRGDTVVDVMAGGGYYTRLFADAVGPKGRVIALMPLGYFDDPRTQPRWDAVIAAHPNASLVKGNMAEVALPQGIDLTMFHLTYHDLYWESAQYKVARMDPAAFLTRLFAATKPGGAVLVVDHVGPAGVDPRVEADRTHRIDPAVVKADFAKAGFVLEAESPLLANPADDRAKLVFDPAVRGKTDRFVMRFRKPQA